MEFCMTAWAKTSPYSVYPHVGFTAPTHFIVTAAILICRDFTGLFLPSCRVITLAGYMHAFASQFMLP